MDTPTTDARELARAVADELRPLLATLLERGTEAEYLTLAQVARRTGFSYDFVYDAARRGDLPATKKGREWRVAVTDMRTWMDKDRAGNRVPVRSELKKKVSRLMPGLES